MTAVAIQKETANGPVPAALAATADSATELLRIAVEKGASVEQLEKLVSLHERMEARQAAREFSRAMAAFQAECPSIKKGSTAKIVTSGGGNYTYTYAELDDIARTINPIMAKHGLSYSWDSAVDGDKLTCVCTVRHDAGHSVSSTFILPIENKSAMSPQQKVGAALTFAQRKSLGSVMGLTTTDEDTDAGAADPTKITEDQVTELADFIKETGANLEKVLKFARVESLPDIRAVDYASVVSAVEEFRKRKESKEAK